ncbi:aldehyde dehydrogenase family protein, partial [Rhodococcus sp. NPDC127530]
MNTNFPAPGLFAEEATAILSTLGADVADIGGTGDVVSRSPINGEVIGRLQASTAREVDDAITSAA